jgi:hypothetical protein
MNDLYLRAMANQAPINYIYMPLYFPDKFPRDFYCMVAASKVPPPPSLQEMRVPFYKTIQDLEIPS